MTKDTEIEVMTALHNLSNTVIANTASRALAKSVAFSLERGIDPDSLSCRMKSRPEFRHVFASSSMFYRALHTVSTAHYRLPVRRYILDLFDFALGPESVSVLVDVAMRLHTAAPHKGDAGEDAPEKKPERVRVVSMFGRVKRPDSSDEEDESDLEEGGGAAVKEHPVISLRPLSKIVGFDK